MGDNVAELLYGVTISEEDFESIFDLFYSRSKFGFQSIDDNSPIRIKNPYETEDFIVFITESEHMACNGSSVLNELTIKKGWDEQLDSFLLKHNIVPSSKKSWILIGHYA